MIFLIIQNYAVESPKDPFLAHYYLLFYTNDIFLEVSTTEHVYMYADDTLLLNPGNIELEAVQLFQNCFNKLIAWCNLNRLNINKGNTKHLCVSRDKNLLNFSVRKDTSCLGNVDTYDYLGFTIDNRLTMSSYLDKIIKKISCKLHTLNIMSRFITEKTALLIYKVMIMPHYDYVDFVIDSATAEKTKTLEKLHKRAIRIIEYTMDHECKKPYTELYTKYNLTSLYQRHVVEIK